MAEIMREIPQDDLKTSEKDSATSIHGYNAAVSEPNPALDRRILWRRDLVLVPTMGILYMILFLDRTNIANARILGLGLPNGLEMSLNMPSNGYNTALWIFYIPFVLAEIPANLLLSRRFIRPGLLLGGQMFVLGKSSSSSDPGPQDTADDTILTSSPQASSPWAKASPVALVACWPAASSWASSRLLCQPELRS